MIKINKHIEIVRTEITHFSSMGSKSCQKIQKTLSKHYQRVGVTTVNNLADLELLVSKRPDLVFLGLKRLPKVEGVGNAIADDVWISEYLDDAGISYTGSDRLATELEFDKSLAKELVNKAGLPTAKFFTAIPGQHISAQHLPLSFPLFIKPLNAGGGKGINDDSVVHDFSAFQRKIQDIYTNYGCASLVEQYLQGREFSVAILENAYDDKLALMPIEIITQENARGDRILSSQVKIEDNELVITVGDKYIRAEIINLATDVYRLLGARDLGRIDIRTDSSGKAHFLEANLMPGPGTRYFAGACFINQGMDYETMILRIVELGLARSLNVGEDALELTTINSTLLSSLEPALESI